MTPEYGILLFLIGMFVTVIFFMLLFWAMDDRPKTKNPEIEEDNAMTRFWKRYNSVDKS